MSTVTDLESYQQFAEQQQAQNNAWSAEQAQKQMEFQERMSSTAHQREVKDLQAAGLNPILSVNSGASVPNGASAEADKSTAGNVGAILQQVLSAQSAREVAGMYNAATLAAASIAANASMYGADVNAQTQREYPNSIAGILSRLIRELQGAGDNSTPGNSGKSVLPTDSYGNGISSYNTNTQSVMDYLKDAVKWVKNGVNSSQHVFVNGRQYPNLQNYFKQRGWNYSRLSDMQQRYLNLAYTGFLKGNTTLFLKLLKQYKVVG